jgi:hypothetical protein
MRCGCEVGECIHDYKIENPDSLEDGLAAAFVCPDCEATFVGFSLQKDGTYYCGECDSPHKMKWTGWVLREEL